MPWHDWQFWVATGLALSALVFVVRPLLPKRGADPGCGNCGAGKAAARSKRTTLTIRGK